MSELDGLSEAQAMALSMFDGDVPCYFSYADPACEDKASWIALFVHEENIQGCEGNRPWPLCPAHLRLVRQMTSPFWQMWMGVNPPPCDLCAEPIRVDKVIPL